MYRWVIGSYEANSSSVKVFLSSALKMEPATENEWDRLTSSSSDGEEQAASDGSSSQFNRQQHVAFLMMMYESLPHHYQYQEINRITLAHFAISGLCLLGALDRVRVFTFLPLLNSHDNVGIFKKIKELKRKLDLFIFKSYMFGSNS